MARNTPKKDAPSEATGSTKKPVHFEFGGPLGAAGIVFGLPFVVLGLYFVCNAEQCVSNVFSYNYLELLRRIRFEDVYSDSAMLLYLCWLFLHVAMERLLPGEIVHGTLLPNGKRLSYVMSGHLQFWLTFAIALFASVSYNFQSTASGTLLTFTSFAPLPLHLVYDLYPQLATAAILVSFVLAIYLYATSFIGKKILAVGGNTGYQIYDFFIGRELNPRIGSLDLKEFCELRPGLILWALINIGMAFKQFEVKGYISLSMICICLFQGMYVWDGLYNEKAILSTMDITTDGFGFMLAFGDLAWVPFIYTLQARYLVDYDPNLSVEAVAAIIALQLLGFYIFRSANSEKDAFRRDPDAPEVSHLSFLQTKRGTKLITSGWWGTARKINYTGDWLITLSWCLLCGFNSPWPYFQAVYFAILLITRAQRDDLMCFEKYGDDWVEYKKRVPYVFIPYVY